MVAEAIITVTDETTNLDKLILSINHFGKFPLNVSLAVLCMAFSKFMQTTPSRNNNKTIEMVPVAEFIEFFFDKAEILNDLSSEFFDDFLTLLQLYLKLVLLRRDHPEINNELRKFLEFQPDHCNEMMVFLRNFDSKLHSVIIKNSFNPNEQTNQKINQTVSEIFVFFFFFCTTQILMISFFVQFADHYQNRFHP